MIRPRIPRAIRVAAKIAWPTLAMRIALFSVGVPVRRIGPLVSQMRALYREKQKVTDKRGNGKLTTIKTWDDQGYRSFRPTSKKDDLTWNKGEARFVYT